MSIDTSCSSVVCILKTINSFMTLCSWYNFLKRLASIGKMTSSAGPQPYPHDVAYELPTPGQQEAIRLLDGQDVNDVFAYLKYARSAVGSPRCGEGSRGHEGLLPEQVDAIKTLSVCADRKLRTWLGMPGRRVRLHQSDCHIQVSDGISQAVLEPSIPPRAALLPRCITQ